MADSKAVEAAARVLAEARRNRAPISDLAAELKPRSVADGYAVQDRLIAALGIPVYGFKVGMTTPASQRANGLDGPLSGRLLGDATWRPDDVVQGIGHWKPGIEAEFAFVIARPPAPAVRALSREEVVATVGSCHLAFEIIGSRYADKAKVGWPAQVADNTSGVGFVLGAEVAGWQSLDFAAVEVTATADGAAFAPNIPVADRSHPLDILGWFFAFAAQRKWPVLPGQVVTTGTCIPPTPIPLGRRIVAAYRGLGEIACTVAS